MKRKIRLRNKKEKKKNEKKTQKKNQKKKKVVPAKKRLRLDDDDDKSTTSESSVAVSLYSDSDDSLHLHKDEEDEEEDLPSSSEQEPEDPLLKPKITKNSEDPDGSKGYYAVVYTDKLRYYLGKINKTFTKDVGGVIDEAEVEFLKRKVVSSNLDEWTWEKVQPPRKPESEVVPTNFILYGPVKPVCTKNGFKFPERDVTKAMNELYSDK